MNDVFAGGCLCGAVRYRSGAAPQMAGHCYCTDCRRASGTGHATHVVAPAAGFAVTGDVKFYNHPADSGNIVGRGFCPTCGSAVYSVNEAMPGVVFIRASSLDDPDVAAPSMSVYASRAPSWDHVDPAIPSFAIMPEGGPQAAMEA